MQKQGTTPASNEPNRNRTKPKSNQTEIEPNRERKRTVDQTQDKPEEARLNEALSALMDGEAGEFELRRVLREVPAKPELAAAWRRYHAVRASLQQEVHVNPRVDLLQGVQARLAEEATHQGSLSGLLRSRIVRYVGQGAIAASVAAAALMGVSVLEVAGGDSAGTAQIADASPVLNGEFNASEQTRTVSMDAEAYNRLQQTVYREFNGSPQLIPYTPEFPAELTPAE
jgi:negative regulator of sigma E activity